MNSRFFRRHRSWSDLASAFADGSLEPASRADFESHLAGCERCRAQVADTGALRTALQSLPDLDVPRSFRLTPALLTATDPLDTASKPSALVRAANIGSRLTAGVAAAALAAVFVVDFGFGAGDTDQSSTRAAQDAGAAEIAITSGTADAITEDDSDGSSGGSQAPDATSTADELPTAPAYDGTPAIGSGAAPEESPEPMQDPENEQPADPPADAEADRELFTGEGDDATNAGELEFATIAGVEEVDDSTQRLLRGLQVALGAVLVAALGAILVLRTQFRARA
jgi:anti-sigma factor RsiW